MKTKGLVMVFTGEGKGKTTAALGMALRALGHGLKVLLLQFIKGPNWDYGELKALEKFESIEIRQLGTGFTWTKESLEEDLRLAEAGFLQTTEAILSGWWDMVILDEILYVLSLGLLSEDKLAKVLKARPETLHVVLTGRGCPPAIFEVADLVTEMQPLKHPFNKGIKAQRGVEF